jgi:hypothetical protein
MVKVPSYPREDRNLSRVLNLVAQQGRTGPHRFDLLIEFSIFYSKFSQTFLRGSCATCVVFEMFPKRK